MKEIEKYKKAQQLVELFELIENKQNILQNFLKQIGISETPDFYGDFYDWIYKQFPLLNDFEMEELQEAFIRKDVHQIAKFYNSHIME